MRTYVQFFLCTHDPRFTFQTGQLPKNGVTGRSGAGHTTWTRWSAASVADHQDKAAVWISGSVLESKRRAQDGNLWLETVAMCSNVGHLLEAKDRFAFGQSADHIYLHVYTGKYGRLLVGISLVFLAPTRFVHLVQVGDEWRHYGQHLLFLSLLCWRQCTSAFDGRLGTWIHVRQLRVDAIVCIR